MDAATTPLASHEVRWFFDGPIARHAALKRWFETATPLPKRGAIGPPQWRRRLDEEPDVYLLIPGADDMGIKWREHRFQIKGRVSTVGNRDFCGRFQGNVERWVKWSYARIPDPYRRLFTEAPRYGLLTASVHKTRALRTVRLEAFTNVAEEVDPSRFPDRGIGVELTDVEAGGKAYCSLGFEAVPDDDAMAAAFTHTVEAFLTDLDGEPLNAAASRSYPEWLAGLPGSAGDR